MQAHAVQFALRSDFLQGVPRLPRLQVEAETVPRRIDPHVHIHAEGHPRFYIFLYGKIGQYAEFLRVIDMNQAIPLDGPKQVLLALGGAVEDDQVGRHTVREGLVVFEAGDHLRHGTLLVEDAADRVQVIRLVRPCEAHLRIACGESPHRLAHVLPQRTLGKDEQRRAEPATQAIQADTIDLSLCDHRHVLARLARHRRNDPFQHRSFVFLLFHITSLLSLRTVRTQIG